MSRLYNLYPILESGKNVGCLLEKYIDIVLCIHSYAEVL